MHADRVNIFHVTYRDAVARAVAHHFVLNFFPSRDAALHKHLSHTGKTQAVFKDFLQLELIMCNASAAAAKRICRTKHHRIADCVGKSHAVRNILHDKGSRTRLTDFFHGILEFLPVLGFSDGCRRRAEELYIVGCQKAALLKLHAKV